jgi:hypothetical protein
MVLKGRRGKTKVKRGKEAQKIKEKGESKEILNINQSTNKDA